MQADDRRATQPREMMTMSDLAPAKAIARHIGAKGARGGWIYVAEKPICQGWFAFEQICRKRGWIVSRSAPLGDFVNWRKVPSGN